MVSSPDDIVVKRRGRKPGSKSAHKAAPVALYQDPKTGKNWSGPGGSPARSPVRSAIGPSLTPDIVCPTTTHTVGE